ncbi:MAG: DUF2334 domain-containing protein [Paracoccaceae bacterium]|nr:DUF2334 domain-containing protein [Paracoccaceae bacterium]
MAQGKRFLPEIHDLHPGMADRLDRLIAVFPEPARAHIAYSVVPNWHGQHPLSSDLSFAERVSALPGEKVLHGWTHTKGPDLLNWVLYGHENRSEFQGLSRGDTEERLDLGLAMFAEAGLARPGWFCAPRWMSSPSLDTTLKARGFRGVLARDRVKVFGAGQPPLPPLNFDEGARSWKIGPGRVLRQRLIAKLLKEMRPFRFVLHPDDLDHPKTFAQIERTMARLLAAGWTPIGLDEAITAP